MYKIDFVCSKTNCFLLSKETTSFRHVPCLCMKTFNSFKTIRPKAERAGVIKEKCKLSNNLTESSKKNLSCYPSRYPIRKRIDYRRRNNKFNIFTNFNFF